MLETIPIRPATVPLVVNAALLAALLGKSLRTIRTLDSAGKLPVPLRIGGSVVWRVSEINEWLAAGAPKRVDWVARSASRQK